MSLGRWSQSKLVDASEATPSCRHCLSCYHIIIALASEVNLAITETSSSSRTTCSNAPANCDRWLTDRKSYSSAGAVTPHSSTSALNCSSTKGHSGPVSCWSGTSWRWAPRKGLVVNLYCPTRTFTKQRFLATAYCSEPSSNRSVAPSKYRSHHCCFAALLSSNASKQSPFSTKCLSEAFLVSISNPNW